MRLAQDEHVVGEWKYAEVTSKKGFSKNKTEASLVLTNKRIVHDVVDKHSISREEIQLKEITAINYYHSKKSNLGVWIKIIFGIITAPLIIGIFILKNNIPKLGAGDFTMSITTSGFENIALSIGAEKSNSGKGILKSILLFIPNLIFGLFGKHVGNPKEVVKKMHIAHNVIDEIIDVLGATVMDSKVKNVTLEKLVQE